MGLCKIHHLPKGRKIEVVRHQGVPLTGHLVKDKDRQLAAGEGTQCDVDQDHRALPAHFGARA